MLKGASITMLAMVTCVAAADAQEREMPSMAGSWELNTRLCSPPGRRCLDGQSDIWTAQVAVAVHQNTVIFKTPPTPARTTKPAHPFMPGHADTLTIDGNLLAWLPQHRGITRHGQAPQAADFLHRDARGSTHLLWPGESWMISRDGSTLVHTYSSARKEPAYHVTWTYHRQTG